VSASISEINKSTLLIGAFLCETSVMNLREASEYLKKLGINTSKSTLARRLKAYKVGNKKLEITPAQVDAYLKRNETC
jgi:hypothetical protein